MAGSTAENEKLCCTAVCRPLKQGRVLGVRNHYFRRQETKIVHGESQRQTGEGERQTDGGRRHSLESQRQSQEGDRNFRQNERQCGEDENGRHCIVQERVAYGVCDRLGQGTRHITELDLHLWPADIEGQVAHSINYLGERKGRKRRKVRNACSNSSQMEHLCSTQR